MPSALRVIALLAMLQFTGCITFDYHPAHYEIRPEQIAPFPFTGPVAVRNVQAATDPVELAAGGAYRWKAPYQRISEELAQRLREELESHGVRVDAAAPVELRIFLDYYHADPGGFVFRGMS